MPYTAGSDAHVRQEVGNGYTAVEVEEVSLPAIREALAAGKGRWHGEESSALYVAQSPVHQAEKDPRAPLALWKVERLCAQVPLAGLEPGRAKRAEEKRDDEQRKAWEKEGLLSEEKEIEVFKRTIGYEEGDQDSCP